MAHRRFIVISEKRPDRCDVCHQSDLFNPETGICERCRNVPVEQLINPDVNIIRTIPASTSASAIATALSSFCLSASLVILNGSLGTASYSAREDFHQGLLALSGFNLFISVAMNRWCSDRYSERLDYRVVPMGIFCSCIGLIASVVGVACSIFRVVR